MKNPVQAEQKTRFSQAKLKALETFLRKEGFELPSEDVPLRRLNRKRAPLSYAQQRLWFIHQLQPDSTAYHMPTAVRLGGQLHIAALERSLEEIVRRHEVLRTRFVLSANGDFEQVVMPEEEIKIPVIEVEGSTSEERQQKAAALALQEFERPFDLSGGWPYRTCVYRLGPQEQILLFVIHHVASDAWSQGILLSEVKRLYSEHMHGGEARLEEPSIQYTDYSLWQREWLQSGVMKDQLQYWHRQLSGMKGVLELPSDYPRPLKPSTRGSRFQTPFDEHVNLEVRRMARVENVSLFMFLLAAFQTFLWRYSGEKDIAIGVPIANRNRPEIEKLIGIFVNTLVMRTVISEQENFRALLQRVKETVLGAFANQDIPFEKLVEELKPERDSGHTPLFQVMFDVQTSHRRDKTLEGLSGVMHYLLRTESKFDLTCFLNFDETTMRCTAEYRNELFERQTIIRMCMHFQELLQSCLTNPDTPVGALSLLTAAERTQIAYQWNQTKTAHEIRDVVELFEQQVQRSPEAIAVEDGNGALTYRELNRQANQLGRHLQNLGMGPEMLVGVCMERSREMVVSLLGVLKAGAAYVPLDPAYPADRLQFTIGNCGLALILTHEEAVNVLPSSGDMLGTMVLCWGEIEEKLKEESGENLGVAIEKETLAYVIYTSGSTGKPKGAMVTHQGLGNYLQWSREAYQTESMAGAPVHSSIGFDLTVTSLYGALLSGGRAMLVGQERGADKLREKLERGGGKSLVKLTPAHLEMLSEGGRKERWSEKVGVMVIGGEALHYEQLEEVRKAGRGKVRIINEYGPTETVVGCCVHEVSSGEEDSGGVPIGKPIANTEMYILDVEMELVPVGVVGEIYIGGQGVGRGYWGEGGLTAERFVPHRWSEKGGERLYRSGDLGRYRVDGVIEYIGRVDQQVKVRGYRIELGEIEAVLMGCEGVREAVVVVREEEGGDKRLVGYVVAEERGGEKGGSGKAGSGEEWKEQLKKKLPEYMVPVAIVELEQMPLTENGKIDRHALPRPERAVDQREGLPRNELDLRMKAIWEDVLQVPFVGRTTSFFDLGGHSLLAIKLTRRITEEFGREVPLSVLFENPTVEYLSDFVRRNEPLVPQSCLLPLQPRGSKPPLFFVHPIGGNGLCFMELVRLLKIDHPFYAFQVVDDRNDDDDIHDVFSSIEGRAQNYIQALRKIQPEGPYWLGGWSFGGYVAYEMARQLVQQQQEVKILFLLDITTRIGRDAETADDVTIALRLANELKELAQQPEIVLPETTHIHPDEQMQYILDEMIQSKLLDAQTDMKRLRNYLRGFRKRRHALKVYEPRPYSGTITLFRTDDVIGAEVDSPTDVARGWAELSPNPVRVYHVPGRHNNMVFMPHVTKLAEAIRECLQNVES